MKPGTRIVLYLIATIVLVAYVAHFVHRTTS